MLSRLEQVGLIQRIHRGTWWISDRPIDPFSLPEYLSAPYPSYVSLQSALHLHGLIEQIPGAIFSVSLARTQRISTSAGDVSFHHIKPELFTGFETQESGVKIATAQKALFDVAYLAQSRLRSFTSLPELDLPRRLDRSPFAHWLKRVRPAARRKRVEDRLRTWGAF
jgi:predicted transcriptional regulator of viral defense system